MAAHGTPTYRKYVSRIIPTPIIESSFPAIKIHMDCISINSTCGKKKNDRSNDGKFGKKFDRYFFSFFFAQRGRIFNSIYLQLPHK